VAARLLFSPIDITKVKGNGKLPILRLTKLAKRGFADAVIGAGIRRKSYSGNRSKKVSPQKKNWKQTFNSIEGTLCTVSLSDWQASCYFRHPGALTLSARPT
jgi:hypothetical protein